MNLTLKCAMQDSFVAPNDEVDFADVGVYTQAMQVAQAAIQLESPTGGMKKNLRSRRRNMRSAEVPKPKRRKRIIVLSDDDDD